MSNTNPTTTTDADAADEQADEYTDLEDDSLYTPERMVARDHGHTISFGTPEQVWEEYALELAPILKNGEDTGRRMVLRNGEFLADVSDQYRLLPNERMVAAANQIAKRVDARPFHQFSGDWYVELDDHVFMDDDGRRAHALYAFDEGPVDLGHGDDVQLGFAVHNSIDGSMGFQVGLFTFRHACANMVMMGVGGSGMGFDTRDVIQHGQQRHTKGLNVDTLEAFIEEIIEYGPMILDTYSAWMDESLDASRADQVLRAAQKSRFSQRDDIPAWMQDTIERVEKADERAREHESLEGEHFANGLPDKARAQIIDANIPEAETVWDAYNDLTQNIWHSEKTNDRSKIRKMKTLHRSGFEPAPDDADVTIR